MYALASSDEHSETEGGFTPPPPKRARISNTETTTLGEPSSSSTPIQSISDSSTSKTHPSSRQSSRAKTLSSRMQTNGVVIENGGESSVSSKTKLVVSNGTFDDSEDGELKETVTSGQVQVRKRKQPRKLTGMEADTIRLMGQHLREMGYQ